MQYRTGNAHHDMLKLSGRIVNMPPCADTRPRTVHKHLERIRLKQGVETCVAAVMRVLAACDQSPARESNNIWMKSGNCALSAGDNSY